MHVSVVALAVPLPLGRWGIVAGVLGVAASWLVLAHPDLLLVVKMAGVLPIVLYEIALGIWLLFRGRRVQ